MTIQSFFTIMLLLLSTKFCIGQTFDDIDFIEKKESDLPKFGHGDLHDYIANSNTSFAVKSENKELFVHKYIEKNSCEFILPNGKLVGEDLGEWIGTLKFIPFGSTKKEVLIIKENVTLIFEYKNEIYFGSGLNHKSFHSGALYKLDTLNGNFKSTKYIDFDYPPDAYTVQNDSLLIAIAGTLFIFSDNKKTTLSLEGIAINSIVLMDDKTLFMGMKGGYAKLDLITKEKTYYFHP